MSKEPQNMIISDPKGELYQYTAKTLERLGYKVYTLDFKTPLKSSKYNFLQPVIEAFSYLSLYVCILAFVFLLSLLL